MASANEILQRMEEIQAARAEAIKPLAEIQEKRGELQRQLAALDEPYGKAFAEAEAAGWTTDELKAMGADEPLKRPKGRPRGRRTSAKKVAETGVPTVTVPAQESSGDAAAVTAGALSS
jgi:hypothetical protein